MLRARAALALVSTFLVACGGASPPPGPPPCAPPASASPVPSGSLAPPPPVATSLDRDFLKRYVESRFFTRGEPRMVELTPDGKAALFLRSAANDPKQSLFEMDVATGAVRELLTPEALARGPENLTLEERARRERMRITASGFTSYELSRDGKTVVLPLSGQLFALDRATGKAHAIDVGKGAVVDPHLSPDGKRLAYVQDDDLHVVALDGGKPRALTRGGTADRTHGLAEFAASEELGRYRGFWWSPDGAALLYEDADATELPHFTIADPSRPDAPPDRVAYPRAGTKNAVVRLGIVRLAAPFATTWVDWDRAQMPYVSRVTWSDGAPPSLVALDRLQKNEVLLVVDPKTGKTREVVREHDDAWVTVHSGAMQPEVPRWLPDGSAFLWWSERDGQGRYGLVPAQGGAPKWLTPPDVQAVALRDVDAKARTAIVEVTRDGLHYELARTSLDGGELVTVSKVDDGAVKAEFGEAHDVFVARESSLSRAPRTVVRSVDGKLEREVPSVADSAPLPVMTVEDVGPEKVHVGLLRPRAAAPGARTPVIDFAYAGPGSQQLGLDARRYLFAQWLADAAGASVAVMDTPGTPGRGRDWERANLGKIGEVPLEGHVRTLRALGAAHPELDLAHVGVYGWSFGGYFAALAVLRHPELFQVGVAIAPVTEWRDYDTAYTERYLGLPQENAAAYDAGSVLVAALAPKPPGVADPTLLVMHGTGDDNVYFFNSLKLVENLAKAGKPFSFVPFLAQTHQMASPQALQAAWLRTAETLRAGLGAR